MCIYDFIIVGGYEAENSYKASTSVLKTRNNVVINNFNSLVKNEVFITKLNHVSRGDLHILCRRDISIHNNLMLIFAACVSVR